MGASLKMHPQLVISSGSEKSCLSGCGFLLAGARRNDKMNDAGNRDLKPRNHIDNKKRSYKKGAFCYQLFTRAGVIDNGAMWRIKPPDAESAVWGRFWLALTLYFMPFVLIFYFVFISNFINNPFS